MIYKGYMNSILDSPLSPTQQKSKQFKTKTIIGNRYGKLTVVEFSHRLKYRMFWICECDCGVVKKIDAEGFLSGKTKSCGCLQKKPAAGFKSTHGEAYKNKTKEYMIWASMKGRCLCATNKAYKDYGGRGIMICDRWLRYENFLSDMGRSPGKDYSIDRKDNDGNYEPSNCFWATRTHQNNNKRNNRNISYTGEVKTLAQWSTHLCIKYQTLHSRLNHLGFSIERAFTKQSPHI
jgi:hypothetical protein